MPSKQNALLWQYHVVRIMAVSSLNEHIPGIRLVASSDEDKYIQSSSALRAIRSSDSFCTRCYKGVYERKLRDIHALNDI